MPMAKVEIWEVAEDLPPRIAAQVQTELQHCFGRFLFAVIEGCTYGGDNLESRLDWAVDAFAFPPSADSVRFDTLRVCEKIAADFAVEVRDAFAEDASPYPVTYENEAGEEETDPGGGSVALLAVELTGAFWGSFNQGFDDMTDGARVRMVRNLYQTKL